MAKKDEKTPVKKQKKNKKKSALPTPAPKDFFDLIAPSVGRQHIWELREKAGMDGNPHESVANCREWREFETFHPGMRHSILKKSCPCFEGTLAAWSVMQIGAKKPLSKLLRGNVIQVNKET